MRRVSLQLLTRSREICRKGIVHSAQRRAFGIQPRATEVALLNRIYGFEKENNDPNLRLTFENVNSPPIPPEKRSARTPDRNTDYNSADRIERYLRSDGHRIWGLVVYRTTYSDDSAWKSCIERLHTSVRDGLEFCNGHDLLDDGSFKLTIIEDREFLEGASSQTVREHFQRWCSRMLHQEQGSDDEIEARRWKDLQRYLGSIQRYEYCIQIDEESQQSINAGDGRGGTYPGTSWVKIIKREYPPSYQGGEANGDDRDDCGYECEDEDEVHEAIEGNTSENIGWMKFHLQCIIPSVYNSLRDSDYWNDLYLRPPHIAPYIW